MTKQRHRTLRGLIRLAAVVSVFLTSSAWAVEPEDVRAWLEGEIESYTELPDFKSASISYTVELHSVVSDTRLEQLLRKTKDRPDHPDRIFVDLTVMRRTFGPQVERVTLFAFGNGMCRVSIDRKTPDETTDRENKIDYAMTGDLAWRIASEQLVVLESQKEWPRGANLQTVVRVQAQLLDEVLTGGMRHLARDWVIDSVRVLDRQKDLFEIVISYTSGELRLEEAVTARWDSAAGRAFVERRIVTAHTSSDYLGSQIDYLDWVYDDVIQRWRASEVRSRFKDGALRQVIKEVYSSEPGDGDFESLTAVPTVDGHDPVRGALYFSSVRDYTGGKAILRKIDEAGRTTETKIISEGAGQGAVPLRTLGWFAAALVVIAIVVLRYRNSR